MELGIDPLKLQLERSILDNILRLPIESGSAPEKFVRLSSSDRSEPLDEILAKNHLKVHSPLSQGFAVLEPGRSFLEISHSIHKK